MKTTPKDFFLWAGAMIALYVSVFSFIALMFEYINRAYPDPLAIYIDPYSSLIRFSIASLAILLPAFLGLMYLIRRDIAKHPGKNDLWVRRWALTLTLFVAGATVAIDLVTLVNTYLGGEISMRFALKVIVVLLVALGGFLHFLADLRGYWTDRPERAMYVGVGAVVLAVLTIASGILIMGTPSQVRLYRFDQQKVTDLQGIQWRIVDYWQQHAALPASLGVLSDPISNYAVPADAQTGAAYTYAVINAHSFKLCATFNAETQALSASDVTMPVPGVYGKDLMQDSWWHSKGDVCFDRTIDPAEYPPAPSASSTK